MDFKIESAYKPTGDQPQAIEELCNGLKNGTDYQTLLGVTGSGKTFTMANVIGTDEDRLAVVNPWNLEEGLLILLQCRLALLATDALLRIRWLICGLSSGVSSQEPCMIT